MKNDTAVCSECDQTFPVSHYGRRIPCPYCHVLLDVMPDDPPAGYLSRKDWLRAIKAKIAWLSDSAAELQDAGYSQMVERIQDELIRLRAFVDGAAIR